MTESNIACAELGIPGHIETTKNPSGYPSYTLIAIIPRQSYKVIRAAYYNQAEQRTVPDEYGYESELLFVMRLDEESTIARIQQQLEAAQNKLNNKERHEQSLHKANLELANSVSGLKDEVEKLSFSLKQANLARNQLQKAYHKLEADFGKLRRHYGSAALKEVLDGD